MPKTLDFNMKLKIYIAATSFFILSSCSVQLTKEARMVREIQPDWKNQCKFIGVEEVSNGVGFDVKGDIRNAKNMMRNRVAQLNGNAYLINDRLTSIMSTDIQFEVYSCPQN